MADYLAENGCIIDIIGQLSVNDSVQFFGLSDQAWGSGFPFIFNVMACVGGTGWFSGNYSNQEWGWGFNNANRVTNVSWGAYVDPCPDYLPWSSVNTHATQRSIRDEFLGCRRQERLWHQYNKRNPLVNPRVHQRGKDGDSPVTQYLLLKLYISSVRNCLLPVASVGKCLWIECKITLCVTRGRSILFVIFGVVGCQILYCIY